MEKMIVSDLLNRVKNIVVLEDEVQYKRVTIKSKNAGIVLRDIEYGHNIGTKKQFIINKGQFLLSKIDARNGAFGIVDEKLDGAIITGNFWAYEVNKERLNIEWFNIFVSSSEFISICDKASSGTTNRRYLDETKFLNYEIKLPSLNEQDIFVKRYKKLRSKLDLINSEINIQEKYLKDLRNCILQDAVQGKLVPQNPNDEPAEVLLEKIREEKERLIKEKKIKKEKALADISKEEEPWVLNDGWSYVRMNDICKLITDGTHSTPNYVEKGIPFISVKDISRGVIDFSDTKFITQEEHNDLIKRCKPEFGDILLTKIGTTGIAKVIDIEKEFSIFVSVALLKLFNKYIYNKYIEYVINSPFVKKQSEENTQGVGNKNLVLKCIKNFIIPIPPLEEQKRIVDKVDSLMKLCDELEDKIEKQKNYSNKLMESILKSSFSN